MVSNLPGLKDGTHFDIFSGDSEVQREIFHIHLLAMGPVESEYYARISLSAQMREGIRKEGLELKGKG
jgi:hypothetical protein